MACRRPQRHAAAVAVLVTLLAMMSASTSAAYGQVLSNPGPAVAARPAPAPAPTPDPAEPPALGYIPPFAPATAPPATDIKPRVRPSTGFFGSAAVAQPSLFPCQGYSGMNNTNPVGAVEKDIFAWSSFAPYQVGNGAGDVNWRLNPYPNGSWHQWLHSLRWVGGAIIAGLRGDVGALDHVRAIAKDWVRDNPYPWTGDIGADGETMHRTTVLLCLREAITATAPGGVLPVADQWLDTTLLAHAAFLRTHWVGPGSNTGTDQSFALLGVGCLVGHPDLRDLAVLRLSQAITTVIDPQGATNEQSTAYAQFNYSLWGRVDLALTSCQVSTGTTIAQRRRLLANFVAQSTSPLGQLAQIGDSETVSAMPLAGTDAEWAGSQGTRGTVPNRRVSLYQAGYAFGRSGWGDGATPFRQESFYSLRYGPGRQLHGHEDHTSLTYVARGRDILIDGGHAGYVNGVWRVWARSEFAHNVMTVPTATSLITSAATLTRYAFLAGADFFEVTDPSHIGVRRIRDVLVLRHPDVVVVLDRGSSAKAQQWQTLWHLPSDQAVKVYSRTTAIATKSGENTQTILFQVPFRQALPRGAILAKRAQTTPTIQGWHYPNITRRNPASTLMFARSGLTASILSVIVPLRADAGVGYTLVPAAGGWTNLNLSFGGTRVQVRISAGGTLVRG